MSRVHIQTVVTSRLLVTHQDWPPLGPDVEPQPPGSSTARCLSFIFVYRFCGYSHIGCSQEALLSR